MSGSPPVAPPSDPRRALTLYHDIEQDLDSTADRDECRSVVRAFLALEARYGVPVTYNVAGRLVSEQPDLIEWITGAGQEVAFHSYHHQPDWQPAYYADEVARCRSLSPEPRGYRSPRSQWDESTLTSAWQNGFLWNAESDSTASPYFIHEGLVRLPIASDDWPLQTGAATLRQWVDGFGRLLDGPAYFGFGSHDSVASLAPRERLAAWEQVLQLADRSGRDLLTFSQAADLFRRRALSEYYSDIASDWNRATNGLYRTSRFREMIRAEAEKLERPAVADLGSGGGVLTTGLRDLASVIHCVDNSEGMLADVDSRGCVRPQLGEATGSGLPDASIDLVVCARVIEYLFWPDLLADEIRRIARPGATYLVTFPAERGEVASREGPAPDRIRRYFTADEIERWASRIGPGRLHGVQYDAAERSYRAREQSAPPGDLPTNWVYIGQVEAA